MSTGKHLGGNCGFLAFPEVPRVRQPLGLECSCVQEGPGPGFRQVREAWGGLSVGCLSPAAGMKLFSSPCLGGTQVCPELQETHLTSEPAFALSLPNPSPALLRFSQELLLWSPCH